MKQKKQMWVSPEFKKMLKKQAADQDVDVLTLTERLAKQQKQDHEQLFKPITKHYKRIL